MFKNLQILFRRMFRNKADAIISLSSITLGLTAVLLAFTFILDERGYDTFHSEADRIFRVNKYNGAASGERSKNADSPGLMAPTLAEDFPEVSKATHIAPWFDEVLISYENESRVVKDWLFADTEFLNVFDFKILEGGTKEEVLAQPGQVLITPKLAEVIFGDENPVGKSFQGLNDKIYTVSGIIEAAPRQSHIQYDLIASWASTEGNSDFLDFSFLNNWLSQTVYSYVLLNNADQVASVNNKLPAFTAQYMPNRVGKYEFYLQPLKDIYLHSNDLLFLRGGKYGSAPFLRTFTLIALLVLLIACFNYINTTTARSLQRAKEVGVRKVLGAGNQLIVRQFLVETLWMTIIAAIFSYAIAWFLLPKLNQLFLKDIPVSLLFQLTSIIFIISIVLVTSLISGLFPGLLLTKFRPIHVLKDKLGISPGGRLPRQVLTTVQLSVGISLIAGTLLLNQQFRFLLNRDLGFDKDQILVMSTPPGIENNVVAFREELSKINGIQSISICQAAMGDGTFGTTFIPEGNNGEEMSTQLFRIDSTYFNTYGINLVAGRLLNRPSDGPNFNFVVNETFVKQMGWESGIGKTIQSPGSEEKLQIVGVIEDFNYNSLHQSVDPIAMYLDDRKSNISVRLEMQEVAAILPQVKQLWERFEDRYPFDYYFMDEFFARKYQKEQEMLGVISVFAAIAIFIACLGLYGMIAFNVARRFKEIGIRKVLGASIANIFGLLTQNFLLPLIAAIVIAIPLSWYFLNNWLQNFSYHVNLSWWIFALASLLMLVIMLFTVSFQSLKAAVMNPVHALRSE